MIFNVNVVLSALILVLNTLEAGNIPISFSLTAIIAFIMVSLKAFWFFVPIRNDVFDPSYALYSALWWALFRPLWNYGNTNWDKLGRYMPII